MSRRGISTCGTRPVTVTVIQVMMLTVKLSNKWIELGTIPFLPLSSTRFLSDLIIGVTRRVFYRKPKLLALRDHLVKFVFLIFFCFLLLCCDFLSLSCVLSPILPVSLDCPISIDHSVFSIVYFCELIRMSGNIKWAVFQQYD